jgi:hypothetical protein
MWPILIRPTWDAAAFAACNPPAMIQADLRKLSEGDQQSIEKAAHSAGPLFSFGGGR